MKPCKHPCCPDSGPCRKAKTKKIRKPLRRVSKKRARENRKYSPLSKQFIQDNPMCVIKSPDCIGITQGVHHVRGKIGERLMKVEDFLPACNPCNSYVEKHDKWARNKGFKKSRLAK